MGRRFFELYDDVYVPRRWHLRAPVDSHGRTVDDGQFTDGRSLSIEGRLCIPVEVAGRPLDFSEAGIKIPVIHVKVASVFSELAPNDVQLFPVHIKGQPEQYLLLVATRLIRCIDERASKVQRWTPEDGRPDKVGQYYAVDHLHVEKTKVGSARVFRPEGWEIALIVSEEIKEALERIGATGVKFQEV
ncbi:MAG TPA: DUF1629 domain-containing protein [Hyalangium sp.]|jgi:hypothetical protein|nr:DUF1629 domain-containing protein [Hyalangium sp.]